MKFFLISLVLFYNGCTNKVQIIKKDNNELSLCKEELEFKSLNYLEQSYRCKKEEY